MERLTQDLTVGITGTREGTTRRQLEILKMNLEILWEQGYKRLAHGDCVGVDCSAHNIASKLGYFIQVHPPVNSSNRAFCSGDLILEEKDYLTRNKDIVDCCDLLLVVPKEDQEVLRSGTWSTKRYATRKSKVINIIKP